MAPTAAVHTSLKVEVVYHSQFCIRYTVYNLFHDSFDLKFAPMETVFQLVQPRTN